MCFPKDSCVSRPTEDTWIEEGDNIGFKKKRIYYNLKRKKNLLNSNGRIHPESQGKKSSEGK